MSQQKRTKKDTDILLIKVIRIKNCLESGGENLSCIKNIKEPHGNEESKKMISDWKKFCKMSIAEQNKIRAEWEQYYKDVQETPIYMLFKAMGEANNRKDYGEVKALALEAKKMREDNIHAVLDKPLFTDPWEFYRGWVKAYENYEQLIIELNEESDMPELQEAANVFGS